MAQLYELDLAQVSDKELRQWYAEMDEGSRLRVDAMANPRRRRASIAGDHLARTALAEKSGKAPEEICIFREGNGKPCAAEGQFSISHSGSFVVCAVSEHPVGVDVECIRKPPLRVARRYFTDEERSRLKDDEIEFWRIWTGKEALCKRAGEGIAGLKECNALMPPAGVVLTTVSRDDYVVAVAEQAEVS